MSLSVLALIVAPCITWSKTVPFQITWPPPSFHTCWILQPTMLRRGCDRTLVVGPKLLLCFLQGDTEDAALGFDFVLGIYLTLLSFLLFSQMCGLYEAVNGTPGQSTHLWGFFFFIIFAETPACSARTNTERNHNIICKTLTGCLDVSGVLAWSHSNTSFKIHRLKCSLQDCIVKHAPFGPAHSIILLIDKPLPDKVTTAWNEATRTYI